MRRLHQTLTRLRSAARAVSGRATPQALVRPARFVLRLDDADLPGALVEGDPASVHTLQQRIAEVVRWRGPLPVTVLAHRLDPADGAAALVRFAHRLECPTTLVHDGPGLDDAAALALVDAGLGRAIIRVGGVDAATHEAVVGSPLDAAQGAIAALLAAREERGARLEVVARVPWRKGVGPDPSDLGVALRQWGVDRWHLAAAYRADAAAPPPQGGQAAGHATPPALVSALDALPAAGAAPGLPRAHAGALGRGRCPVAAQRLVLTGTGAVYSCPFHPPLPAVAGELPEQWAAGDAHRAAIRSCDRACAHPELAPLGATDLSPQGAAWRL